MKVVGSWDDFSTPDMFRKETIKAAWSYWNWRILRADVEPGNDYKILAKLIDAFGRDNSFVQTSNIDQLHVKQGHEFILEELHGSLARL